MRAASVCHSPPMSPHRWASFLAPGHGVRAHVREQIEAVKSIFTVSVCLSKHLSWASKINFIREDFSTLSFLFSLTPLSFLCTHLPLPPSLLSLPVCYLPAGSAPQACWGSVLDESHTLTICCPQTPHCWPRARRHARTCTCGTHAGPLSDEV